MSTLDLYLPVSTLSGVRSVLLSTTTPVPEESPPDLTFLLTLYFGSGKEVSMVPVSSVPFLVPGTVVKC